MRPDRDEAMQAVLAALRDGRFGDAAERVRPFVADDDPEALTALGLAYGGLDRPRDAAALLCTVGQRHPDRLHPVADLMALLSRQHRARDAEPVLHACLEFTPQDSRLWVAAAQLFCDMGRLDEASAALERNLALSPGNAAGLNQRAIIAVSENRILDAIALFRDTVAADPDHAPAWANLGCVLAVEGAFEEALDAYRRSIRLRADEPQVRLNHSICLLKAGRMTQGWLEHEWRLRLPGHTQLPPDRLLPTLAPDTDLSGRSVLLTHEEGIGDTLMYLRYAPLLAERGARVIAFVPPALAALTARVPGIAAVRSGTHPVLDTDWHCPFISLPRVFCRTAESWGAPVPYLDTDPDKVAAAETWLPDPAAAGAGLRVGLVWGGAPRVENLAANGVDRRRSIGLAALAPLAGLRGVSLVSLQHGPHAAALAEPPAGLAIHDPMPHVADLDDTAALIRGLDVVVSVDTSVAHLAGALGVPVILLDRYDNCWRWLHGRDDSPWYPSLTILRQETMGDWHGVVDRLVVLLQDMAETRAEARDAA